jgi:hypothetical protein
VYGCICFPVLYTTVQDSETSVGDRHFKVRGDGVVAPDGAVAPDGIDDSPISNRDKKTM